MSFSNYNQKLWMIISFIGGIGGYVFFRSFVYYSQEKLFALVGIFFLFKKCWVYSLTAVGAKAHDYNLKITNHRSDG